MEDKCVGEKMAQDDLFFATVVLGMGLYFSFINWQESDWIGFVGTLLLAIFGGLWLSARIYHLTHADEVFKSESVDG